MHIYIYIYNSYKKIHVYHNSTQCTNDRLVSMAKLGCVVHEGSLVNAEGKGEDQGGGWIETEKWE